MIMVDHVETTVAITTHHLAEIMEVTTTTVHHVATMVTITTTARLVETMAATTAIAPQEAEVHIAEVLTVVAHVEALIAVVPIAVALIADHMADRIAVLTARLAAAVDHMAVHMVEAIMVEAHMAVLTVARMVEVTTEVGDKYKLRIITQGCEPLRWTFSEFRSLTF